MGKSTSLDDKPTRKRPLQIQISDRQGALIIVLIGPHDRMRDRLFTRLGRDLSETADDHRFTAASFDLGGMTIDLVNWHSSLDPMDCLSAMGKASFALCIDPSEDENDAAFKLFVEPLKEGLLANACVALISDGKHLDSSIETEWSKRVKDASARCKLYRINCDDSMSPELFAKLFIAGVRDIGDDDHGIQVQEIER